MSEGQQPLVILDRDGVINQDSAAFIKSPDEFIALPGSIEAIGEFCRAGFRVVIASNQSGIGRGLFSLQTLEKIHSKFISEVESMGGVISGIFFCPHKPEDNCSCRKPKPGLLEEIAKTFSVNLDDVPVIGDSMRDLDAAIAVNAQPVLVRTGNGRKTEDALAKDHIIPVFDNLGVAAAALIASMERQ